MSLPLKRRIARVALVVAAAVPVVGLGSAAASAATLPQATDLGGLSSSDAASTLGGPKALPPRMLQKRLLLGQVMSCSGLQGLSNIY